MITKAYLNAFTFAKSFGSLQYNFCTFLLADEPDKIEEMLPKFYDFQRKADMYYAYHSIQRYTVSQV